MTIEERAKEYAQSYSQKESAVQWSVERAYGTGAAEQKKIDIEKACEWLKEHKLLNDKYVGLYTKYCSLSEFIKAMEE